VSANTNTTTETGDIEFVIVGQDQGTGFRLWDVVPAPTDPDRRAALLEEWSVDAMDALGDLTTEWADSPRAAVEQLLVEMRERSGFDDYDLTADSQTECLGAAPEPAPTPEPDLAPYGGARAVSAAVGTPFRVFALSQPGTASLTIDGLPNRHGIETRDRVRAGIVNSGLHLPHTRLSVQVTACDVQPKHGSSTSLDLAIACTALAACNQIAPESLAGTAMIGELGLDGKVRIPHGLADQVRALAANGVKTAIVPGGIGDVLDGITGIRTICVGSLNEALAVVAGHWHHPQDCVHCANDGGPHRACTATPRGLCSDCAAKAPF
jgi:hypothetical protein